MRKRGKTRRKIYEFFVLFCLSEHRERENGILLTRNSRRNMKLNFMGPTIYKLPLWITVNVLRVMFYLVT